MISCSVTNDSIIKDGFLIRYYYPHTKELSYFDFETGDTISQFSYDAIQKGDVFYVDNWLNEGYLHIVNYNWYSEDDIRYIEDLDDTLLDLRNNDMPIYENHEYIIISSELNAYVMHIDSITLYPVEKIYSPDTNGLNKKLYFRYWEIDQN